MACVDPVSTSPKKETKMIFTEYHHMESEKRVIEKINDPETGINIPKEALWYATEKIHGTNFSFLFDDENTEIFPCRRGDILIPTDGYYYGYRALFDKYKDSVMILFNTLKTKYPTLKGFQVYGELFGGSYAGKTDDGAKKVQAGIYYVPFNEFLVFDIKMMVRKETCPDEFLHIYLGKQELIETFDELKRNNGSFVLSYIPPFRIGTLDELLSELNPKFESEIYKLYGLEKMVDNYAEGFVLHPYKEFYDKYYSRVVFKYKNPSFSEVIERKPRAPKEKKILTPEQELINKLIGLFRSYTTKTRYDNIFTKLPEPTIEKLTDMMIGDIIIDLLSDNDDVKKEDIDANMKILTGIISGAIKKWFSS